MTYANENIRLKVTPTLIAEEYSLDETLSLRVYKIIEGLRTDGINYADEKIKDEWSK